MGVTRNRVEAGKKAAATNRKKSATYYVETGSLGGRAVAAIRRAFSSVPGLAQRAAAAKYDPDKFKLEYVVRDSVTGEAIKSLNTRALARGEKHKQEEKGLKVFITQIEYSHNRFDGGMIVSERQIR